MDISFFLTHMLIYRLATSRFIDERFLLFFYHLNASVREFNCKESINEVSFREKHVEQERVSETDTALTNLALHFRIQDREIFFILDFGRVIKILNHGKITEKNSSDTYVFFRFQNVVTIYFVRRVRCSVRTLMTLGGR